MLIPKLIATNKETCSSWHEYATYPNHVAKELGRVSCSQAAEVAGVARSPLHESIRGRVQPHTVPHVIPYVKTRHNPEF
jgi:hypothetical protein